MGMHDDATAGKDGHTAEEPKPRVVKHATCSSASPALLMELLQLWLAVC